MGRRSRLEMRMDVLSVLEHKKIGPTHIMYKANLSWTATDDILQKFLKRNMVIKETGKNGSYYSIADKGRVKLKHYKALIGE